MQIRTERTENHAVNRSIQTQEQMKENGRKKAAEQQAAYQALLRLRGKGCI